MSLYIKLEELNINNIEFSDQNILCVGFTSNNYKSKNPKTNFQKTAIDKFLKCISSKSICLGD